MFDLTNKSDCRKMGELIRKERENQELTIEKFAEMVGVSRATIYQWEMGNNIPHIKKMSTICKVLKVDYGYLMGLYEHKTYTNKEICNYTGLDEKAVEIISSWGKDENSKTWGNDLSRIIESDKINELMEAICFCIHFHKGIALSMQTNIQSFEEKWNGHNPRDIQLARLYHLSKIITDIVDNIGLTEMFNQIDTYSQKEIMDALGYSSLKDVTNLLSSDK